MRCDRGDALLILSGHVRLTSEHTQDAAKASQPSALMPKADAQVAGMLSTETWVCAESVLRFLDIYFVTRMEGANAARVPRQECHAVLHSARYFLQSFHDFCRQLRSQSGDGKPLIHSFLTKTKT